MAHRLDVSRRLMHRGSANVRTTCMPSLTSDRFWSAWQTPYFQILGPLLRNALVFPAIRVSLELFSLPGAPLFFGLAPLFPLLRARLCLFKCLPFCTAFLAFLPPSSIFRCCCFPRVGKNES